MSMKKKEIDVPLPPKDLLRVKKHLEKEVKKTGWYKPNIFLKNYLIVILIGIFNIFGVIFLFLIREQLGYLFLIIVTFYIGIGFPLQLGLGAYTIIRLYLDKNKITNEIKKVLPVNFIIAYFFLTQKKLLKRVCIIDSDGISYKIGKGRYIIDSEKVFYDENRFPCGFWLPNLPNQLGFDFSKELKRVSEVMKEKGFKIEDLENEKGETIDVTYSSRNLEVFRKDKVFKEFHQHSTPETMKLVYMLLGVLSLMMIIGFVLIIILRGG